MDSLAPRPKMIKQGSSLNVGGPQLIKQKTTDLSLKKMLEPKSKHASYVKKKKLNIDYENPEFEMKDLGVKYDFLSIISRLNMSHGFDSTTADWVISEMKARKNQLPPKAAQILSIPNLPNEPLLRLLNLKNCVMSS